MNMQKVREYEGHTDLIEPRNDAEEAHDLSNGIATFCFTVGAIVVGIGLLVF